MTTKILNLYAGIGGNRKLWSGDIKVTAIEIDKDIANIYKEFFPEDDVIIANAHEYLLEHYKEFDFIWSSPPCPSHSKVRRCNPNQNPPIYPDMKLYEEIIFLMYNFNGKWVIENTFSYYEPLIRAYTMGGHLYWSNFIIPYKRSESREHEGTVEELQKRKGFDLSKFKNIDKVKVLRNCVEAEDGLFIFNLAFNDKQFRLSECLEDKNAEE